MPDRDLITSIQADIREIRQEGQRSANKLSSIDENLKTIYAYMQTCNAERDAIEKRVTTTENTQEIQARNLRFIGCFFGIVWTGTLAFLGISRG